MKVIVLGCFILAGISSVAAQSCVVAAKELPPVLSNDTRQLYEAQLAEARENFQKNNKVEAAIWLGRRVAYLGSYKEAIGLYSMFISKSEALGEFNPRLYRHRGHRYITLRCFGDAVRDFEKAAKLIKGKPDEIELDGMPNARNIPTSTLQSNIWYHLGLAYYLTGNFKKAERAYAECQKVSKNNDMLVATVYWRYMTLRRLGKAKKARELIDSLPKEIDVIENDDYLKLIKLNRGEVRAEELLTSIRDDENTRGSASLGYGVGNYFLYNGHKDNAMAIFRQIVKSNQWSSFGYIAAEIELRNAH